MYNVGKSWRPAASWRTGQIYWTTIGACHLRRQDPQGREARRAADRATHERSRLAINLNTAKALGLTIPPAVLARGRRSHSVTPPIWLDAAGRRRPTRACWTCGREVPVTRMRAEHLRPHGWLPGRTLHIPAWCGCTTEYVPVPVDAGCVATGADLGARSGGESPAAVRAARAPIKGPTGP